jgi:hypothetical protein
MYKPRHSEDILSIKIGYEYDMNMLIESKIET